MGTGLNDGTVIRWDDEKGFGFIKPRDGEKEVFLHIAVVKTTGRRPKIGDIIFYQLVIGSNGRNRASSASIQGVAASKPLVLPKVQDVPSPWKLRGRRFIGAIIGPAVLVIIALVQIEFGPRRSQSIIESMTKPGCIVKGNVSQNTGNKLYHIPGMENYDQTVIDPKYGERWFCSEAAAVSAGFGQKYLAKNAIIAPAKVWTYYKIALKDLDFWTPGKTLKQIAWQVKGIPSTNDVYYFDDVMLVRK